MKTLEFSKNLIPLIISGEKTTTWRLFNHHKDLKEGDEVIFLDNKTKQPFAEAILIEIKDKTLRELTEEDKKGHEKFESEKEMFKTYSNYYKTEVRPDTPLKIIKFRLLEKI